jgi:hypothetical protein
VIFYKRNVRNSNSHSSVRPVESADRVQINAHTAFSEMAAHMKWLHMFRFALILNQTAFVRRPRPQAFEWKRIGCRPLP